MQLFYINDNILTKATATISWYYKGEYAL